MDSADSDGTFNSSDLDVTFISPVGSPGVSNDVEILGTVITVSDGGDGVIELGSAGGGVDNTGGVTLEDTGSGADGDGGWSTSDGSLKLGSGFWCDVVDAVDEDMRVTLQFAWARSSLSISSSVWNSFSKMLSSSSNVHHGFLLPSSTATSAVSIALNNLLLSKIVKSSFMLDSHLRLDGGSC